jgi:hypothetical protein
MTSRAVMNKKLKKIGLVILSGLGVFTIGAVYTIWRGHGAPPIVSFVGFGVAFVAIFYAQVGIKCPNCRNRWGYIAVYKVFEFSKPFKIFSISNKIRYCPFCGIDIDKEI